MDTLTALQWRYAVKKFSTNTLSNEQIMLLAQSTRLSPSAFGLQPFKLIVVSDQAIKTKLLSHSFGQDKVANCSHLFVLAHYIGEPEYLIDTYFQQYCSQKNASESDVAAYRQQVEQYIMALDKGAFTQWAKEQTYLALGTLLTSAAINNIDSCPMTGIDPQGFDEELKLIDSAYRTTVICPLGFRDEDDKYAYQQKVRTPYEEFVEVI
ncbi:nitroreductase family protein [Thalassotalea sediminis]|uniref:nitroreductase family protein n=1 Tax=Thalassotalea sediminis TaxID=1759089 RepID=UPI0025728E77|nr:nitroreductase family protein [Thalassotalea sediminis]